jgi:hypothetical protein
LWPLAAGRQREPRQLRLARDEGHVGVALLERVKQSEEGVIGANPHGRICAEGRDGGC